MPSPTITSLRRIWEYMNEQDEEEMGEENKRGPGRTWRMDCTDLRDELIIYRGSCATFYFLETLLHNYLMPLPFQGI